MSSRQTPSWISARKGLALVTVLGCGALAPLAGAGSASAATPATGGAPQNGPIAFTGNTASGTGWIEVNPDGSDHGGRHEVVPSGAGIDPNSKDSDVVFSPDGTRVLFVQHGDGSLWVAGADGSNAHRLTTLAPGQAAENPAWSADASTVYFSFRSTTGAAPRTFQLMQVPSGGGTATPVSGVPASDNAGFALTASPDGSKLAYSYFNADSSVNTIEVAVIDAKTHALISTLPEASDPQYSPDGKMLAVQKVVDGKWAIVAFPPDGLASPGSQGRQLAQTTYSDGFAFSPDSSKVAYDSSDAAGHLQLVVQPVSGGSPAIDPLNEAIDQEALSWQNAPLYTGPVTPPPSQIPPRDRPTVNRLGGADRIDTSVLTADAAYAPKNGGVKTAQVAVLSRADSFADALAGDPLAAAKRGPLMLTGSGRLDPRVAAELTKTLEPGSVVYILGGTGALGPQIDKDVAALGYIPRRIAGGDRFDTAVRVAKEISPGPATVMVATGLDFPDALTAGAAAESTTPGVVVLTDGTSVPPETKAYLASLDRSRSIVYGVGGQAVTALQKTLTSPFVGLSGADRYATAAVVLNRMFGGTGGPVSGTPTGVAGLATGHDWPDALSGGAHIGPYGGPLLLSDGANIPAAEAAWLHGHSASYNTIDVFGGTKVVPQSAATQAANALWGDGNWSSGQG